MKLFNEGKLLRYLGYAVGEIALIIIGIMMALQLNNWNEDRKAQEEFDLYIVQLKADVRMAIENVKGSATQVERQASRCEFVLNFLSLSEFGTEELAEFELGLSTLGNYDEPQVYVGLLGDLMNGNKQILGRNRIMAQKSLAMESEVKRMLNNIGHHFDQIDLAANNINQFRGKGVSNVEAPLYHLETIISSPAFAYNTQTIVTRLKGLKGWSERIARELESFLAVLEEYE